MKFIIVFCAVAACALAGKIDEQTMALIGACVQESGTTQENALKVADGDFSVRDEPVQCFVDCFFRKSGLVDENGHYNVDTMIAEMNKAYTPKKGSMEDLIRKCAKLTGKNQCEASFNVFECAKAGTVKKDKKDL